MAAYDIAWLVVAGGGLGAAALVFAAVRRVSWLRYLAPGLVLVWALTPYRFAGQDTAPAFVVALFRLLFEDDADPLPPLALLGAASAAVLALHLLAMVLVDGFKARRAALRRRRAAVAE